MVKIIDGTDATMGRLASYVAKEALKGEELVILNCDKVIITGNKENILGEFLEKRGRVGSGQLGPKVSRLSYKIVKRAVRGMLPHRSARGKNALKRVICHNKVPKEFEGKKMIRAGKEKPIKYITVGDIPK
mgnify:FL=1